MSEFGDTSKEDEQYIRDLEEQVRVLREAIVSYCCALDCVEITGFPEEFKKVLAATAPKEMK